MIHHRTPTRADDSAERMTERVFVNGPESVPLTEVLDALDGTSWEDVAVHSLSMSWQRPATEAERVAHLEYQRYHEERRERWERETYERLRKKYG